MTSETLSDLRFASGWRFPPEWITKSPWVLRAKPRIRLWRMMAITTPKIILWWKCQNNCNNGTYRSGSLVDLGKPANGLIVRRNINLNVAAWRRKRLERNGDDWSPLGNLCWSKSRPERQLVVDNLPGPTYFGRCPLGIIMRCQRSSQSCICILDSFLVCIARETYITSGEFSPWIK